MPTFCRHNRFIERCPICSKTLPGAEAAGADGAGGGTAGSATRRRAGGSSAAAGARAGGRGRPEGVRVRHEGRAADDGYRNGLVPGLRASADAERLAGELAFSSGRLALLTSDPPGLYGQALETAAAGESERALWICFLCAYLCPLEPDDEGEGEAGRDPFAGIRLALAVVPDAATAAVADDGALDAVPLGPRSSHQAGRGGATLRAYADWVARSGGGAQERALSGDPTWSPARRFGRVFERLAMPGLSRAARYELLVTVGRLGLVEMSADAVHLGEGRGAGAGDETTGAAKRVFGIGDPLLLDRRAGSLAEAASLPLDALDLALASWGAGRRIGMGFGDEALDLPALERARAALGL